MLALSRRFALLNLCPGFADSAFEEIMPSNLLLFSQSLCYACVILVLSEFPLDSKLTVC